MSKMYNPPHPGELVKSTLVEGAGISVTDAADLLGISRGSLSKLINCHSGISPEMAIRLSIALNTSSEMWLNAQKSYDLWAAEKNRRHLKKEVTTLTAFQKKYVPSGVNFVYSKYQRD